MNSTAKVILGILAGLAVGAIFGILFAPDKGVDTRKKITKKGEDAMDSVRDKFEEFLATIKEKFEKVKEDAAEVAENGRAQLDHAAKEVKSMRS